MLDQRSTDGTTSVHYTMKTPHSAPRPSPGLRQTHSHSHSQSKLSVSAAAKSPKPTTPAASPRMPYSVGQPLPPQKLSPARPAEPRAASPNYFGLVVEQSIDPRDSSVMPRDNWSSPTSSVKSFAAALPKQVPIDANPDYEAFKRQADLNRGKGFSLSSSHFPQAPPNPTTLRPRPPRWNTHASDSASDFPLPRTTKERPISRMEVEQEPSHDSAYVSADSKRNSEASINPPPVFNLNMPSLNMPRFESPRQTESPFERRTTLSKVEDRHPRMSIAENKVDPPSPRTAAINQPRAETLPPTMENGPSLISPAQLKELIDSDGPEKQLLLLDLRVSQQYAQARIDGALNLCIPTTLLKRATFNLTKLQQTFQNTTNEERFSKWKATKNLVVYDAYSADKRDAVSCMNMIKKFANEGYTGGTYILRGGFNAFADAYPELVEEGSAPGASGTSSSAANDGSRPGVAPVIGGVMLPMASNNPNPFFSNIRQNMDLADGVGQLDVARPNGLESPTLPRWLRDASRPSDHGKQVSDKFLGIEKGEQARMKAAYSMFGGNEKDKNAPQLCGIEKGGKNRYKDILPFEHARVKLQKPEGACDYVNASHIKASRSNKRYIATQGPLPATFDDFWSVIWEQDVRVIVMLTAESEGGQLKCHPYWQGRDFGLIKLKLLSEKKVSLDIDKHRNNQGSAAPSAAAAAAAAEAGRRRANTTMTGLAAAASPAPPAGETPHVIVRKFALSHSAHPFAPMREITHLHYPSWPDFGAPAQPSHLLGLVRLANSMQSSARPVDTIAAVRASPDPESADEPEMNSKARPMLVHCSAGCGRTGTFCTVDTVIDMLKRQRLAKMNSRPVRKRDSDGDIKMSGQPEDTSPREKSFDFNPSSRRSSAEARRGSPDRTPLDTSWLNEDGDTLDLIQKTVEDFRQQRLSMVQSLRQYVLCYETIVEYVWRQHEETKMGRARSGSLQLRGDS